MRPGELVPVAGPVHLLAGEGGGRFPFCHGVVIRNRRTILIDPGCGARVLMPWAEPGRVELVLNTHTPPTTVLAITFLRTAKSWCPGRAWPRPAV